MRLAVVSPFVDRRHGTERALAEALERLAHEYGCEIHLYSQRVEDLALDDRGAACSAASGSILWHKVPSVRGPQVLQFIAWMVFNSIIRKLHALFGGSPYDLVLSPGINCLHADAVIVHALFHRLPELALEAKEDSGAPGFYRQLHRRLYYRLLRRLERRVYSVPKTSLAAVSHRTARLLAQYFHRQGVRVIPNAVDSVEFSPSQRLTRRAEARRQRNLGDDDFVILLIGNDWRVKGLTTILDSMAMLPNLSMRLVVVGSDAQDSFRAHAKRLGLQDRCHWELPRPDVLQFYAAADVYVSPSREDSFGLPIAEAMACALPVVASAFAGVAELIHDGVDGFILPDPRDAQALARLLEQLQADPGLRRGVGEAAANAALAWSWDSNAAAIWEFLKDCAARKQSSAAQTNKSY